MSFFAVATKKLKHSVQASAFFCIPHLYTEFRHQKTFASVMSGRSLSFAAFCCAEGPPTIIELKKEKSLDALYARILFIKDEVLRKEPKNATIVKFIVMEQEASTFMAWFHKQTPTWRDPLSWGLQSRGIDVPLSRSYELKFTNWTKLHSTQPDYTWELKNVLPTSLDCKTMLHHVIDTIRSRRKYIKVCVRNGTTITPKQVIDVFFGEMIQQNVIYSGMCHVRWHSLQDQEFTIFIQNVHHIDLHGSRNVQEARLRTESAIANAELFEQDHVRIITGRGNHVNRNGQRGVLASALPKWTKDQEHIVSHLHKDDGGGMFNVGLKRTAKVELLLNDSIEKSLEKCILALIQNRRIRLKAQAQDEATANEITKTWTHIIFKVMPAFGYHIRTMELAAHADGVLLSLDKEHMAMHFP